MYDIKKLIKIFKSAIIETIMENNIENTNSVKLNKGIKPVTVLALTFLLLILVGTILLYLPVSHKEGMSVSLVRAFFTATSAVCVTGLTIANTYATFSVFGQVVIILLIQLGGLGLMTIATLIFIFAGKRITLKERLILQEAYSSSELQGLVKLTKKIVKYTLLIEGMGAILLSLSFVPKYGLLRGLWSSVFISISAFCNAGFDILGPDSLTGYASAPLVLIPVMLLIICGGIGFFVITDVVEKNKEQRTLKMHTKLVLSMTTALILIGASFYFIVEFNNPTTIGNMTVFDKIINSLFQSVSTRTAGFNTFPQLTLSEGSQTMTNALMFIGASPGGTGGGIKTTTFFLLIVIVINGARGNEEITTFKKTVKMKTALRVVAIVSIGLLVITIATSLIHSAEVVYRSKIAYSSILFECFSAYGTVGLSHGITSNLSNFSLIVLSIVMFIGRLGSLILGLVFAPKNQNVHIKYAEFNVTVG